MTTVKAVQEMSLDGLEAGRELDALIAERLFDYNRRFGPWVMWKGDPCWRNAGGFPMTCPHYSTDMTAAWEVVEQLDIKWHFTLSAYYSEGGSLGGKRGWRVELVNGQRHGERHTVEADTAPLAICKAALKVQAAQSAAR